MRVDGRETGSLRGNGIPFTKMHGAGNDFVVLDLDMTGVPSPRLCRALANRHTGVGCDLILGVRAQRSAQALVGYRIWTPDGASSRQCGNGGRCVAAWARHARLTRQNRFAIESPSGIHEVEFRSNGLVTISLGAPEFVDDAALLRATPAQKGTCTELTSADSYEFTAVSMGNPHAVAVVKDVDVAPVSGLAQELRSSGVLEETVNVNFVQVLSRDCVKLRVHEFGAGETLSCATCACASVAVLARRGLVSDSVSVVQAGGVLGVTWGGGRESMRLEGSAVLICEGVFYLDAL